MNAVALFLLGALVVLAPNLLLGEPSEAELQKMRQEMKQNYLKQKRVDFAKQKQKDRLVLVTDNSFLPKNHQPLAGGPVLVVVRVNTWEERGVDGRLLGRSESDAEIVFSVKGQAPTLFLPRSLSRAALTDVAPVAELSTYAGADNLAAVWVIAPPTGGSRDLEISFGAGGIRGEFQDKKTLKVRIMGGPSEREVSTQIASALKAYGEHLVKAGDQVQGQEIFTYGEDGKPASRTQFQRQKARDGRAELVPLTTPNPYLVALSITPGVSSPVPIRSAEERAQLVQAPNWLASHRGPRGWVSFVRVGRTGFASLETWDLERPTLGVQSKMFLYASSGIIEPRRTVLWRLQKAGEGAGVDKTIEIETFEPRANSFRARSKVLRRQVDEKEKTSKP